MTTNGTTVRFSMGGSLGLGWAGVLEAATTAEELGFHGYYPADHITPGQPIGLTNELLEATTLLAA